MFGEHVGSGQLKLRSVASVAAGSNRVFFGKVPVVDAAIVSAAGWVLRLPRSMGVAPDGKTVVCLPA